MFGSLGEIGVFQLFLYLFPSIYFIRGLFRSLGDSVLSLIIFPLSLIGFIFLTNLMLTQYMVPSTILGLFKAILICFLIITALKWLLSFFKRFFSKFLNKGKEEKKYGLFNRFLSGCVSCIEGALILICGLWFIDYFDIIGESKYNDFYREAYQNRVFQEVTPHNPVYDFQKAKNFKAILTVLSRKDLFEKAMHYPEVQQLNQNQTIRNIQRDKEFQAKLANPLGEGAPDTSFNALKGSLKQLFIMIKDEKFRDFLTSETLYKDLTNSEFTNIAWDVLPKVLSQDIKIRKGLLSGIKFQQPLKKNTKIESISIEKKSLEKNKVVKIKLKNGETFVGKITKKEVNRIVFDMAEGVLILKPSDIIEIEPIK